MMGSANTSDPDAKIFRGYDRLRGREECHSAVECFGDAIKLEPGWETFRDVIKGEIWGVILGCCVLRSNVCLSNKQIMTHVTFGATKHTEALVETLLAQVLACHPF
jgi:hypothetical protein